MSLSTEKNDDYASSEFQQNLEILRQIDFFSGLPMESLKVFAYICFRENFKPGDHLFRQGDDDGQAFFIISGRVSLVYWDDQGESLIRNFNSGEFLGALTLLGPLPRLFSLKADEETTCLIMEREKFCLTLQQFSEVMPKFIKALVDNIHSWEEKFLHSRSQGCEACMHKVGVSLI